MGGVDFATNGLASATCHQCQPIGTRLCIRIRLGSYSHSADRDGHMVQIDHLATWQKPEVYLEELGAASQWRFVVLGTANDTMDALTQLRSKLSTVGDAS